MSEPLVLAAGRLIEKKGFDTPIAACAQLESRGVAFRCRILGTGPLEQALRRQIESAGMNHRIELPGWVTPEAVVEQMAAATVFTMPSRISDTGDRDGIPNVVLEAMAAGLPVVATEVSGIPEAVLHGDGTARQARRPHCTGRRTEQTSPTRRQPTLANRRQRSARSPRARGIPRRLADTFRPRRPMTPLQQF